MFGHTWVTVLGIIVLAAIGAYAKIDTQWAIVALAGGHGAAAAYDGRSK